MMIPTEAAANATEAGASAITAGAGGKLTYENLMKLYQQGKYDQVAKDLEPLAKGGHRGAQELIGIMYRSGQGVPKDPKKAYDYLAEAANANRPLAQYHIGTMYFTGEGVQTDTIMALMWLQIAIVHFSEGPEKDRAMKDRDAMYTHLTRREKDRALQMAREWLTKRGEAHLLDLEGL
jgi:TPR repeat protein